MQNATAAVNTVLKNLVLGPEVFAKKAKKEKKKYLQKKAKKERKRYLQKEEEEVFAKKNKKREEEIFAKKERRIVICKT